MRSVNWVVDEEFISELTWVIHLGQLLCKEFWVSGINRVSVGSPLLRDFQSNFVGNPVLKWFSLLRSMDWSKKPTHHHNSALEAVCFNLLWILIGSSVDIFLDSNWLQKRFWFPNTQMKNALVEALGLNRWKKKLKTLFSKEDISRIEHCLC